MTQVEPWPAEGMEHVSTCPLCGAAERRTLHAGLQDRVFEVAQGEWTLWQCGACGCAYLDPRPNEATIALAYRDYYTHQSEPGRVPYAQLGRLRRCLRQLNHGYVTWRFGRQEQPACALGIPAAYLALPLKVMVDAEHRHLPRPPASGGRLLDLGCGSGSFLRRAQACGWQAIGADPDPRAASHLHEQGIEVRLGGIEQFEGEPESFDAITLSHVIEHVHHPLHTLKQCHALLKPGGMLWVETPNIEALGHRIYGRSWRGLEPPRHLILFGPRSLALALNQAGFTAPQILARPSPAADLFKQSSLIRRGDAPSSTEATSGSSTALAALCTLLAALMPGWREYLTIKVSKKA